MHNSEVIFNTKDTVALDSEIISELKEKAKNNQRKTIRICLHKNIEDRLHQMVIVHSEGAYIRPHKHPNKTESFHMVEGSCWVIIFDEKGNVTDKLKLGYKEKGDFFILRMEKDIWHTVIPITDIVLHEITNGPFTGIEDSIFPEWAPDYDEINRITEFLDSLKSGL